MFTPLIFLSFWTSLHFFGGTPIFSKVVVPSKNVTETSKAADKLTWSETRRLTWDDFKGNPEVANTHHALTAANLAVDAGCANSKITYDVKCVFLPEESWSKNKNSAALLKHEQLHFDLTEVHARLLRKNLKTLGNDCSNLKINLSAKVSAAFTEWKAEQNMFDESSNHGLNKEQEIIWEKNINQRLIELQNYK
jgi:hypothetical protein